jgi:hypothetical protein
MGDQGPSDTANPRASGAEDPIADQFYAGAIRRILKGLIGFGLVLTVPVWWLCGAACASGFAAGAAVSWLNFQSLASGVEGLAGRITEAQSQERGRVVVGRFLLRYLLVGIVAYAIFKSSSQAFPGFLYGLCLPVAAMLSEAAYEAYGALRRGY